MGRSPFAGAISAIILTGASSGALAQNATTVQPQARACTDRMAALTHLSKKYAEAPVAMGLASNGGVLEVLSNDSGRTWTILLTMPSGMSCMLATGEDWERLNPTVTGSRT